MVDRRAREFDRRSYVDDDYGHGLNRHEVFVTTRCDSPSQSFEGVIAAVEPRLSVTRFNRFELYGIHWSHPAVNQYVGPGQASIEPAQRRLKRSIGVSNLHSQAVARISDLSGDDRTGPGTGKSG
jgi:diketogulonate reductase-like aldo/keto reductase